MGRLYLDPTPGYSDPAESSLMVLDAGSSSWTAPADGRLAFDAAGRWTAPVLRPRVPESIADLTWPELKRIGDAASTDRETYLPMVGMEKEFAYGGMSVTARIADIAKEKTPDGGDVGLIFHVYKGMGTHGMISSSTASDGYASSAMKTYLDGLAFPADLHPQEFVLKYRDNPGYPAKSINVKVGLMAASNLYWAGCQGENRKSSYFYSDEGQPYQYFKDHDRLDARIHYESSGEACGAWFLSPYPYPSSSTYFMLVSSTGYANSFMGTSRSYVPSARFCLGSSI